MPKDDESHAGRAPAPQEEEDYEMDMKKKGYSSPHLDVEDQERREKKDHPPRFSTLFAPAPPRMSWPPPQREFVREYYPKPERKSGVFLPMPLFIVFATILFFESTILFAYTVIGLYNNAPTRVFPWAGPGTASCEFGEKQPPINIAPNFVFPQEQHDDQVTRYVTIGQQPDILATTTGTSIPSSTSTPTPTSSVNALAALSGIAGIFGGLIPTTTSNAVAVVTVGPTPSTVTSVKMITEDPSGNVIPPPTTTLTTFVNAPAATSPASLSSRDTEPASERIRSSSAETSGVDAAAATTTPPPETETPATTPAPTNAAAAETTRPPTTSTKTKQDCGQYPWLVGDICI